MILYWKGLLANVIEVKGLEIDSYDDSNLIKKTLHLKVLPRLFKI